MIAPLRAGNAVLRYHTEPRVRPETVGHHSANVCAVILRLEPQASRSLLVAALMHDIDEYVTGDVPAPIKRLYPDLKDALDDAGGRHMQEINAPHYELRPEEAALLKFADTLELILSSCEEVNLGNQYASTIVERGVEYLKLYKTVPIRYHELAVQMIEEVKGHRNGRK